MNILKRHLFIFVLIGIYFIANITFDITCPIKQLTHMPCPTCGMTRALMALISLDFVGYVRYNAMSVFIIIAVWLLVHRDFFEKKLWIDRFSIFVIVVNTTIYFIRIC